jgi:hypothetical protein
MHGDIVSCRSASPAHNAISETFQDYSPCAARHSGLIGIFPIGKPSPQTLRWFRDDFPRVQACLFTSMVYVKTRAYGMSHRDSPRLARISPRPDWPLRPSFHGRVFFWVHVHRALSSCEQRSSFAQKPMPRSRNIPYIPILKAPISLVRMHSSCSLRGFVSN